MIRKRWTISCLETRFSNLVFLPVSIAYLSFFQSCLFARLTNGADLPVPRFPNLVFLPVSIVILSFNCRWEKRPLVLVPQYALFPILSFCLSQLSLFLWITTAGGKDQWCWSHSTTFYAGYFNLVALSFTEVTCIHQQ